MGYKVHSTETCHTPLEAEAEAEAENRERRGDEDGGLLPPNLITDVMTTHAAVPDVQATAPIQLKFRHFLDRFAVGSSKAGSCLRSLIIAAFVELKFE